MATDTFYPNNGIYPPQQYADLVHAAMKCTKSHDEAVAETKRLLGDDVEPRHPSNNATEILQCIMSKLGPGGLWELLRVPTGQRHPTFDPNPSSVLAQRAKKLAAIVANSMSVNTFKVKGNSL